MLTHLALLETLHLWRSRALTVSTLGWGERRRQKRVALPPRRAIVTGDMLLRQVTVCRSSSAECVCVFAQECDLVVVALNTTFILQPPTQKQHQAINCAQRHVII